MIGERIRTIRESRNLSQGDIEERSGLLWVTLDGETRPNNWFGPGGVHRYNLQLEPPARKTSPGLVDSMKEVGKMLTDADMYITEGHGLMLGCGLQSCCCRWPAAGRKRSTIKTVSVFPTIEEEPQIASNWRDGIGSCLRVTRKQSRLCESTGNSNSTFLYTTLQFASKSPKCSRMMSN
jgi:hypothetical protein